MSHLNDIPRPFMTEAVAQVRKPLPLEALHDILATYFLLDRDLEVLSVGSSPNGYITREEWSHAPLLVFLEMGKLSGNRQDVEHPAFVGAKYIGDLQTPSEIGVATLDLRRCFTAGHDSGTEPVFVHAKPPGPGGQNWAFDPRIIKQHHLVCIEDLAAGMDRHGQVGPVSAGAFSNSEFVIRKDMMGCLVQLLRGSIMRDLRGHATASRTAGPGLMGAGKSSTLSTTNAPRFMFIITWDAKSVIAQLDACQLDFLDHCNPDSPVRIIDMQQSFEWNNNYTLESFTTKLGVYPRPNPLILLNNTCNSSFLSALGFLRHTFMHRNEYAAWADTHLNIHAIPAPIDTTQSIIRSNRKKAQSAAEEAISNRDSLRIDAIEHARVEAGLLSMEDRTFKRTAVGLERIRVGPPLNVIDPGLTPAQESADGGQHFYHPVYAAGYLGHDVSAVPNGNTDEPSKMMTSSYPAATKPSYMSHGSYYHENWEAERRTRRGLP